VFLNSLFNIYLFYSCYFILRNEAVLLRSYVHGIIYPSHRGCLAPKTILTPPLQHCPPLEVLIVLIRTLIGSILFPAIGGYWNNLYYRIVVCIGKHWLIPFEYSAAINMMHIIY